MSGGTGAAAGAECGVGQGEHHPMVPYRSDSDPKDADVLLSCSERSQDRVTAPQSLRVSGMQRPILARAGQRVPATIHP